MLQSTLPHELSLDDGQTRAHGYYSAPLQ